MLDCRRFQVPVLQIRMLAIEVPQCEIKRRIHQDRRGACWTRFFTNWFSSWRFCLSWFRPRGRSLFSPSRTLRDKIPLQHFRHLAYGAGVRRAMSLHAHGEVDNIAASFAAEALPDLLV